MEEEIITTDDEKVKLNVFMRMLALRISPFKSPAYGFCTPLLEGFPSIEDLPNLVEVKLFHEEEEEDPKKRSYLLSFLFMAGSGNTEEDLASTNPKIEALKQRDDYQYMEELEDAPEFLFMNFKIDRKWSEDIGLLQEERPSDTSDEFLEKICLARPEHTDLIIKMLRPEFEGVVSEGEE